jgi:hypothetical protein
MLDEVSIVDLADTSLDKKFPVRCDAIDRLSQFVWFDVFSTQEFQWGIGLFEHPNSFYIV